MSKLVDSAQTRDGVWHVADPWSPYFGQVLTQCCKCFSTYCEGELVCKQCFELVENGEGDGTLNVYQPPLIGRD